MHSHNRRYLVQTSGHVIAPPFQEYTGSHNWEIQTKINLTEMVRFVKLREYDEVLGSGGLGWSVPAGLFVRTSDELGLNSIPA
jgi:hypothetical protein